MSGYSSRLQSHESQPQFWSKYQVWDWLQQIMDVHQIDTSNIPLQNFDMDGHQLCSLSYQDFVLAAGSVGPILFHSLSDLKWSGAFKSLRRGIRGGLISSERCDSIRVEESLDEVLHRRNCRGCQGSCCMAL